MNIQKNVERFVKAICCAFLQLVFKILRKELTDETAEAFTQFVKFGIVGVSNTVVSYLLYAESLVALNKTVVEGRYNYLLAHIIEFLLSVLWSFYWNNRFVFVAEEGEERNPFKTLIKTYVSYSITGLFLNSILLFLWVDICGISEFIAPIINLLVSVPLNFIINKFWAFKSS